MKKGPLIRRIVVTVLAFGIFLSAVITIVQLDSELRLVAWPLEDGGSKVLLGIESFEVEQTLKLYLFVRSEGRVLRPEDAALFHAPHILRVGLRGEGPTHEADSESCHVERVRRPASHRGGLRCDLDLWAYPGSAQRILVGGDLSSAPEGTAYGLIGVPQPYLRRRASLIQTAAWSGGLYLFGCVLVVRAVRTLQLAAAAAGASP